jgi:GNAT superfamily N-acetyltransferase
VYVAESGGRVAGFVTCWAHQEMGWGEIGNNAVHPSMRGQGIGPRMYEHVFDVLRGLGIGYVKVTTGGDPAHAPARRAYQKVGFEVAMPCVDYYRKL